MKIKELIEKLNAIEDKEILVLVDGYEGGYDDIKNIDNAEVGYEPNGPYWEGKYHCGGGIKSIILSR
jgi:hypothetical protein